MKKTLLGLAALLASSSAFAQPTYKICLPVDVVVNGVTTKSCQDVTATNPFPTSASGGGSGGTSSNFGSAFPTAGTALGLTDGTNMRGAAGINYSGSLYSMATSVVQALPAGTNLLGKVGIDQTTPGTTNLVAESNFPATVSTGTGAQGASSPRVTIATDSATVGGSSTIPAGTNLIGKVGIDQTTGGSTNGVAPLTTTSANVSPTLYSSPSVESGKAVKASAGNVYGVYVYSTAAGLLMTFNATAVPGDGAVTPVDCIPVNANSTAWIDNPTFPDNYGTGISVALSSGTNCFSKTAIANGFFKVRYK